MEYRRFRKRKKPYLKMSVGELEECLTRFQDKLLSTEKEYDSCLPKYKEYQKKQEELVKIKLEYPKIREKIYKETSAWRRFLSDPSEPTHESYLSKKDKMHLMDIENRISNLGGEIYNDRTGIYFENLLEELQATKNSIKTIKRSIITVSKRKEKKAKNRAIIASYFGKSREIAQSVRKQIKDQLKIYKRCPYCFRELGDNPHCDHIYPVARGGLSSPENMVYICAECNQNKRDYTLREFIVKRELNREKIEENLELLKKRF